MTGANVDQAINSSDECAGSDHLTDRRFGRGATNDPEVLAERARNGDAAAFCDLCQPCESRLIRQATIYCGDPTLAEDLAQETLFEAWKSIRRYNGQCRFFTWLCAIMMNRCRNLWRRKAPVALSALEAGERDGIEATLAAVADQGTRPDQALELTERAHWLRRCLDSLPDKQRDVIYLRFYVDASLEEMAATLRCSMGTVKSRLFLGLEKLRVLRALKDGRAELEKDR